MTSDTNDRRRRIAAALEKQFDRCNEAAEKVLSAMGGAEPDYFNMPIAIALLRTSGQLGAAIARLEPRADAPPSENSEIDGSITK